MKKLLIVVILLMSLASLAQTRMSMIAVSNPPYGMTAQLWNSSTHSINVSLSAVGYAGKVYDPINDGVVINAIGFSTVEQPSCTSVSAFIIDTVNAVKVPVDDGIRISGQPCTPNGMTYGIAYTGPGNCAGFNYTCTNVFSLSGIGASPSMPYITIPPNRGITIYTALYKEHCYLLNGIWQSCGFGWVGDSYITFFYTPV